MASRPQHLAVCSSLSPSQAPSLPFKFAINRTRENSSCIAPTYHEVLKFISAWMLYVFSTYRIINRRGLIFSTHPIAGEDNLPLFAVIIRGISESPHGPTAWAIHQDFFSLFFWKKKKKKSYRCR